MLLLRTGQAEQHQGGSEDVVSAGDPDTQPCSSTGHAGNPPRLSPCCRSQMVPERLGRALFLFQARLRDTFPALEGLRWSVGREKKRVHKKFRAKQKKKTPLVRRVQGEEGTGRKEND